MSGPNPKGHSVIEVGRRKHDDGPTGEVETLSKFNPRRMRESMGERAAITKPTDRIKKLKRKRNKHTQFYEATRRGTKRQKLNTRDDVLHANIQTYYEPKTPDNKRAYEVLVTFLSDPYFVSQPMDVIKSVADAVLETIWDDELTAPMRLKILNDSIFNRQLTDRTFGKLYQIARKITDFSDKSKEDAGDEDTFKEQQGVAIQDLAGDENLEDDGYEVQDVEGDDDSGDEMIRKELWDEDREKREQEYQRMQDNTLEVNMEDDDFLTGQTQQEIDPRDIDAFWINKQLAEKFPDAQDTERRDLAEKVLEILALPKEREAENQLVNLLPEGFLHFEFCKKLIRNRKMIVWCTRLKKAKEAEVADIENQMKAEPELKEILDLLRKRAGTAREKTRKLEIDIYAEAREIRTRKKLESQKNANGMKDQSEAAQWQASKQKMVLDTESLKFKKGGHFVNQNHQWKLKTGAKTIPKKGYQEIILPFERSSTEDWREMPIAELPDWARVAFTGVRLGEKSKGKAMDVDEEEEEEVFTSVQKLNPIQTKAYPVMFNSSGNALVCAPTGAGKTNCAMLSILREIGRERNSDGSINLDRFKIVYIAPMKSLVREVVLKFSKRLAPYGIKVQELTGDVQLSKEQLHDTQIIVTTPEKWDIVTRKGMDRSYTSLVKLVIIDEIHLLHDDRGPVLEAIVARCIRQVESSQEQMRIIGLSATLPNYEDIATFLRVKKENLLYFDQTYRPVPLIQRFAGITIKKPFKRMQLMNKLCYEYVMEQVKDKQQVIIFVHSRKDTFTTAKHIVDTATEADELDLILPEDSGSFEILKDEAEQESTGASLKELLPNGVGIHHAGMSRSDRTLVEDLFESEHLKVLVSTATLAWGVNLPAHAVIIKGTQIYNPVKGDWVELSMLDVLQMFGRAGRPQYDEYGEAYLITTHRELEYYMPLLIDQLPIESQLVAKMPDMLNAEVVLGTIRNLKEAVEWLGYTYLYVRMLKDPQTYGVAKSSIELDDRMEQRRVDLAHTAAHKLDKCNLVKYDTKSGNFQVTPLGRVAAHYYITHSTIQTFNEHLKPNLSDIEIFRIFSLADEFKYIGVRNGEKQELSQLLDRVPIPVKESIEEGSAKINVLLQAYISRLRLNGFALISDMTYVTQSAGRLMRALFEIVIRRGWAAAAQRILALCKMIEHRMWCIESPLRQFKGAVPNEIIRRIEKSNFAWERFYDLDQHELGELIRFPKMGKQVYKLVHRIPRLELTGHVQPITRTVIKVELYLKTDFAWDDNVHKSAEHFWVIVEDVDGESVLHHEYFTLKKKFAQEEQRLSFTIPICDPLPPQYFVRVVSDRWLGSETVLPISFRALILPDKYPPPTELLDLQQLPTSAINIPEALPLYKGITHFNSIQTQCFSTLLKTDENVMIAAPTGSGKTICAELAIIKMLEEYPNGRCVYVAPLDAIVDLRYKEWRQKFGQQWKPNVVVSKLSGDTTSDVRLLQQSKIILASAVNWDKMSRRWRRRKNVQNVNLFIMDELHLVGSDVGTTYEMVVSRMRYMAAQTENKMRFVGLSTSVLNALTLGDWIGASKSKGMFCFHPNVRPVPLEIRINGFDINNYEARQLAMNKPIYSSICRWSPSKPIIVFAPNRKHTKRIAAELRARAAAENRASRFLQMKAEDLMGHMKSISSKSLEQCVLAGIGFLHEHLTAKEKRTVKRFFKAGAIQVIVVDHSLCWGLDLQAHMVIIAGTSFFDGGQQGYVDYKIADMVQMIGRANRPREDKTARCVVLCHAPRRDFFKKFLYEAFPVESHLDVDLADHLNSEIVTRTVESANDALDIMSWSFYWRRLTQNPNYYDLKGTSRQHLSQHLSELVEQVFEDLENANCISVDEDMEVSALNNGLIAAYYYIRYLTVEMFNTTLKPTRKLKGILQVLAHATEFEDVPVRKGEDRALEKLARHLPLKVGSSDYNAPSTKTNVLLQTHFMRMSLSKDIQADRDKVLVRAVPLLWAMVDVLSTSMWLKPALVAMELCQMITQGLWDTDPITMQIPHVSKETAKAWEKKGVKTVDDIVDMDDDDRVKLLKKFSEQQQSDIANFTNNYPSLEVAQLIDDVDPSERYAQVDAGREFTLKVTITREDDEDSSSDSDEDMADKDKPDKAARAIPTPMVNAHRFPAEKVESWFLVVGEPKKNKLYQVKRFTMSRVQQVVQLKVSAPKEVKKHKLMLYLMSDSYMGCDQNFELRIQCREAESSGSDSDES